MAVFVGPGSTPAGQAPKGSVGSTVAAFQAADIVELGSSGSRPVAELGPGCQRIHLLPLLQLTDNVVVPCVDGPENVLCCCDSRAIDEADPSQLRQQHPEHVRQRAPWDQSMTYTDAS